MGKAVKKPKKEKPAKAPRKERKVEKEEEGLRGIVRIAGKDLRGKLTLKRALTHVRGLGHSLSRAAARVINKELGFPPTKRVGELSDEDVEKIDKVLYSLQDYNVPAYLLNRRNDYATGTNKHVIMNDLAFTETQDIEREKKLYTWRGYRHAYGKKVRGQRTRNTGRKGMALGVLRKAILAQQKGGASKEGGGEKKK